MASEGSLEDKSRVVAGVASKLFAAPIPESNVIVETLERVTDSNATAESVRPALGPAIDAGIAAGHHRRSPARPPARDLGRDAPRRSRGPDVDQRWVPGAPADGRPRRSPRSADGLGPRPRRLPRALSVSCCSCRAFPSAERTGDASANAHSFFAFKLHQFISGAGHAFATLERAGQADRHRRRAAVPARRTRRSGSTRSTSAATAGTSTTRSGSSPTTASGQFLARDIDDAPPRPPDDDEAAELPDDDDPDREVFGFLTPHAADADFDFEDRDEDYPETWLEFDAAGNPRLKRNYRAARAREVLRRRRRAGSALAPAPGSCPGKFRFCLRCGDTHGDLGARSHPPRFALGGGPQLGDDGARRQRAALDARRRLGPRRRTPASSSASPTTARTPRSRPGTSTTSSS